MVTVGERCPYTDCHKKPSFVADFLIVGLRQSSHLLIAVWTLIKSHKKADCFYYSKETAEVLEAM